MHQLPVGRYFEASANIHLRVTGYFCERIKTADHFFDFVCLQLISMSFVRVNANIWPAVWVGARIEVDVEHSTVIAHLRLQFNISKVNSRQINND